MERDRVKRKKQSSPVKQALAQHANGQVDVVIGALLPVVPALAAGLLVAKSLIGYAIVRHQEDLNQYLEFIRDNPEDFRKDVIDSPQFQDGFVLNLEAYVKLRSESKRFVARQILLGFAKAEDKQAFPIERLQDALSKVSDAALGFICFVEQEIIPLRAARIASKVDSQDLNASDKSREWWVAHYERTESISKDVDKYLHDQFNPNSQKVKDEMNEGKDLEGDKLSSAFEIETTEREKFHDAMSELVQLGIMGTSSPAPTWGSAGGSEYRFTKFGTEFIAYVKLSDFTSLLD